MSIYLLFTADILSGYGAAEQARFGSRWAWRLCRMKPSMGNVEWTEPAELGRVSPCWPGASWLAGGPSLPAAGGCSQGKGQGFPQHLRRRVGGKPGGGKLKASCNQSRFPGVNRVSVRLKISLPVADRSHGPREEPQSAPGWLTPRAALPEGLWPLRRFVASGTFLLL